MRHQNTRALATYWETLRRGRIAPQRTDVSPSDLSALLPYLFILQKVDESHALFRLAGTGLCDLYRREFRDQNFLSLWSGGDRLYMQAMINEASERPSPAGALVSAETIDGVSLEAEVLIAPLLSPANRLDRFIGLFQPLTPVDSLRSRPLVDQSLTAIYPPNAQDKADSGMRQSVNGFERPIQPMPGGRPNLRVVASNENV